MSILEEPGERTLLSRRPRTRRRSLTSAQVGSIRKGARTTGCMRYRRPGACVIGQLSGLKGLRIGLYLNLGAEASGTMAASSPQTLKSLIPCLKMLTLRASRKRTGGGQDAGRCG